MKRKNTRKIIISIDNASTTNNGYFQGWGSSLCWWANRIGYSDILTETAAKAFYGKGGLGLNIMRYNIGGGDDPAHNHIERTDSAIPGWLVWNEEENAFVYDYSADKRQLNVLQKCYEAAGEDAYVEAFSNSAPYFMTISGCSGGGDNPAVDNLKSECYGEFADYLAHVSKYINDTWKIQVKSIAAMNEPNTEYWTAYSSKQEGCHFDVGMSQSKMLIETARAFKEAGLEQVEVTATDETSTDKQLLSCQSLSQGAWQVIDRLSTHTYGVQDSAKMGQYAKEKQYNLWMSEVDGSYVAGEDAGEMGAALGYARKIIEDMNDLSPSAWVMWQLIDNHISKDGYMGNQDFGMPDVTKGYWGVAVADHDREEIILTKKYYAMGQFTKFMQPGCQMIHCGEDALAALDKKNGILSVVVVNVEKEDSPVEIDLTGLTDELEKCWKSSAEQVGKRQKSGSGLFTMQAKVIRTSGIHLGGEKQIHENISNVQIPEGENWEEVGTLQVEDGKLCGILQGQSITTYVVYCKAVNYNICGIL